MPVLLDTDHLTILQERIQPERDHLRARIDQLAPDDVGTTIISFQEQMQGWLAYLSRARTADQIVHAYAELDANHQLPPGTLARELPRLASRLLARADTSAFDRANALFAANQFAEAEAAALEAADAARKAMIDALLLAGLAADALARYPDELHDYRDAEKLTDQNGDPREWARVQRAIAGALVSMGKFDEALAAATAARDTCEQKIGPDDPETLESRHVFAGILFTQEKNRAAEDEYRAVTAARTRVLGAEHPETLRSRNAMALAQTFQGRHAEAEEEFRTVLAARERVLGAEDPDTLRSRNNLAQSLSFQSKFPEAEQQHRMVLADRERVLGPENPDVFESCFNLAHTLMGQHKLQDALPFALCAEKGYKARRGEDYRYTKEAAARREEIEAALAKEKAKSMEEKEGGK